MENQLYGSGDDNLFQDRMKFYGKEYELRGVASVMPDITSLSKYIALSYRRNGGFHLN